MHYLDEGSGEVLVMIHGNPSWSFLYRHLISHFRSSFRVIVPDHIGCGFSEKPPLQRYPYHLDRRIHDLESFLGGLGLDRDLTLVMHDWGGLIGMGYAVRHPSSVRRLILFNSAAFRLPSGKKLHWLLRSCRRSRLATFLIERGNAFVIAASLLGSRKKTMPRAVRKAYRLPYDSSANRIAVVRFIQDIPLEPEHESYPALVRLEEGLQQLRQVPMLICWGERDFVFDLDFLKEWRRRFPEAVVRTFPHAGHFVLEDEPDAIAKWMSEFLRQNRLRQS